MWDPPQTAGVLSKLTYHLTVINMNTGVVIINTTTTDTSYPLSSAQHCTFYNASVTALSLEQKGDTMGVMEGTPGGECMIFYIGLKFCICTCCLFSSDYYELMDLSPHVLINNNTSVITVIFNVVLQVHVVRVLSFCPIL